MTDLRDKIAATIYCHILFRALDQCECGAAFDGFCGHALDAYAAHVADAVIEALNLNTPVEYLSVDGKRKNFMVAGHYTVEVTDD